MQRENEDIEILLNEKEERNDLSQKTQKTGSCALPFRFEGGSSSFDKGKTFFGNIWIPTENHEEKGWDSDSGESGVSFESNIQEQHIYCLGVCLGKCENSFFKCRDFNILEPISEGFDDLDCTLAQYLVNHTKMKDESMLLKFITLLEKDQNAGRFLKWIYDGSSQIVMPELVFVFQKVFLYHQQFKCIGLEWFQLSELSSNDAFLKYIFQDQSLELLNYRYLEASRVESADPDVITVAWFMRFLVLTLLLVLEGYFNHPIYLHLREQENQQLQQKLKKHKASKVALGLKIKKQSKKSKK